MKRTIGLFLIFIMLLTALAGCNRQQEPPSVQDQPSVQEQTTGTPPVVTPPEQSTPNTPSQGDKPSDKAAIDPATAIRLLLAEERLNAQLLQNEGDIFEQGAAVMQNLADMTLASVQSGSTEAYRYLSGNVIPLDNTDSDEVIYDGGEFGSRVTYDGQNYTFSNFYERSNSYHAFQHQADSIAQSAENAAELIDRFKKSVRVVDKWVKVNYSQEEFYLHVGTDEEILCTRTDDQQQYCRRFRNEQGVNVYEYYIQNSNYFSLMIYVPGVHFEFHDGQKDPEYPIYNYMIADNTKGYWECYWVGEHPTHYNVSYFVMKDDVCYDSFYNYEAGEINFLKVISADKKTDLFYYMSDAQDTQVHIDVHLQGFDGVKGVRVSNVVESNMGGDVGTVPDPDPESERVLLLENGLEIRAGDTFMDGKVLVTTIRLSFDYPAHTSALAIRLTGETMEERLALLEAFLTEIGITCRRDMDTVTKGIYRAFDELAVLTQYYTWHGYAQGTEQGIADAIAVERLHIQGFENAIAALADVEVIDQADASQMQINAHFAPVTVSERSNVSSVAATISIGSLSLSIADTFLFVPDQAYTVGIALAGNDGLILLSSEGGGQTAVYTEGAESLTASVQDVTLTAPALFQGTYTAVAYIVTDDGYRSSECVPIPFDSIDTQTTFTIGATELSFHNVDGTLVLQYELITDVHLNEEMPDPLSYDELFQMLAMEACHYGIPSQSAVEVLTDPAADTYAPLTGDEQALGAGTYRLGYTIQNGDASVQGCVYLTLTEPVAAPDTPEDSTASDNTVSPEA